MMSQPSGRSNRAIAAGAAKVDFTSHWVISDLTLFCEEQVGGVAGTAAVLGRGVARGGRGRVGLF